MWLSLPFHSQDPPRLLYCPPAATVHNALVQWLAASEQPLPPPRPCASPLPAESRGAAAFERGRERWTGNHPRESATEAAKWNTRGAGPTAFLCARHAGRAIRLVFGFSCIETIFMAVGSCISAQKDRKADLQHFRPQRMPPRSGPTNQRYNTYL